MFLNGCGIVCTQIVHCMADTELDQAGRKPGIRFCIAAENHHGVTLAAVKKRRLEATDSRLPADQQKSEQLGSRLERHAPPRVGATLPISGCGGPTSDMPSFREEGRHKLSFLESDFHFY